jgi:DNA-binding winged helix-turn-helix (wHTH) protein
MILLKYDVELYYDKQSILVPDKGTIHFSHDEFLCLTMILEAAPHTVPSEELYTALWGANNNYMSLRQKRCGLHQRVSILRRKMSPEDSRRYIRTARMFGFYWNTENFLQEKSEWTLENSSGPEI